MHGTCLIFNPAAGGPKGKKFIAGLHRSVPSLTLCPTSGPGDASKLASLRASEGYQVVVAAGGDGTINEVVNGLAALASTSTTVRTQLGVLPMGTQNVFARELGIPLKLSDAWSVIERGRTRAADLARVSYQNSGKPAQRFFVQLAGVGFDARAVELVDLKRKKFLGPLEYIWAGLKAAAEKPPRLEIEADGTRLEGGFVVIGNGRLYGGPFTMFPGAIIDDGKLDVVIFQGGGFLKSLRYSQGILRGVHTKYADVKHLTAARLRVTCANPVPLEADGELLGHTPAEFDLLPKALSVLVCGSGGA